MCSVFEFLDMDNFQGDLTDVVRGIGSGNMASSPGPPEGPSPTSLSSPPTSDLHVDFPSTTASASCQMNPFGDPFGSMTDPLLHLTANSSFFSGAGDDNKSNNSFAIFPKVFEDDHIKSQCSVFPRIRISQSNIKNDASTCNSPAMAVSTAAAASPWGVINVDTTNSPRNCLVVDNNNNNTSSSSQIQIASSPRNLGIKRRKSQAKKVVCIPAPAAMNSRSSGEVVPSDLWAWRKYGQKPIKGSPYPRGYYRCSSSKGCSARKQVERSRTDPNMLVITYTSEHNHPWPTQRNALAGSTRSSSSSSPNPSSKSSTTNVSATTSASYRVFQNKEEPNKSQLPSFSTPPPPHAAAAVKEEGLEERQENMEFDNDVDDTYRPELFPDFQHQPEDFFADLDELEGDSLTRLLSHSSGGGNMENKTTIPDVFSDFFDDDDSSRSL
ncbi:putative WRKY transcription factor 35 [Cardamine amara subsp. amara]|uniref:WRKY transcription factor 35 n=1 Tax=Cardamine amara subsp. amara TaxID=228776 RepID=A0ABD1AL15_CARAN